MYVKSEILAIGLDESRSEWTRQNVQKCLQDSLKIIATSILAKYQTK